MSWIFDFLSGPGNIAAIIAAASYLFSTVKDIAAWFSARKEEKVTKIIWDAVLYIASLNGTSVTVSNNMDQNKGAALLEEATSLAVKLAADQGINLYKKFGDKVGIKAAVQSAFKDVKAAFKR